MNTHNLCYGKVQILMPLYASLSSNALFIWFFYAYISKITNLVAFSKKKKKKKKKKIITEKGLINKSILQEKHNFGALFFLRTVIVYHSTLWAVSADNNVTTEHSYLRLSALADYA